MPLLRACDEYRPHPEELAKQASRRMDTTHGLAAILRDAAKRPLLRMRSAAGTRRAREPLHFQEVGGSLRRKLAHRPQPILDMVGANHLAALERVNVNRHQFERLAAVRRAHEFTRR